MLLTCFLEKMIGNGVLDRLRRHASGQTREPLYLGQAGGAAQVPPLPSHAHCHVRSDELPAGRQHRFRCEPHLADRPRANRATCLEQPWSRRGSEPRAGLFVWDPAGGGGGCCARWLLQRHTQLCSGRAVRPQGAEAGRVPGEHAAGGVAPGAGTAPARASAKAGPGKHRASTAHLSRHGQLLIDRNFRRFPHGFVSPWSIH